MLDMMADMGRFIESMPKTELEVHVKGTFDGGLLRSGISRTEFESVSERCAP